MKKNHHPIFPALLVAALLMLQACAIAPTTGNKPAAAEADPLVLGTAAEQRGDLPAALLQYVKAASLNPRGAEAHYRVARVHAALGNGATAREAFGRALALDPAHVGALEGLGLLLLEQRQAAVAEPLLHKAIAADPARWRALDGLGVVADLAGDHALAQSRFNEALAQQPARASLYNNRGYSRYLTGDLAGAKADFEHSLSLQPGYPLAWTNLGLLRLRQGDYAGAVAAFGETMTQYQASNNVGYLLMNEGKFDAARGYLKQAISQSPSYYAAAQENLQRLETALASHP